MTRFTRWQKIKLSIKRANAQRIEQLKKEGKYE